MTKEQFLKRCENIYNMGLASDKNFLLIEKLVDGVLRLNGGQTRYFVEMLESERERTRNFADDMSLANDVDGYSCIQLLAVLTHHCQKCAEDPKAWHTRAAFCPHADVVSTDIP